MSISMCDCTSLSAPLLLQATATATASSFQPSEHRQAWRPAMLPHIRESLISLAPAKEPSFQRRAVPISSRLLYLALGAACTPCRLATSEGGKIAPPFRSGSRLIRFAACCRRHDSGHPTNLSLRVLRKCCTHLRERSACLNGRLQLPIFPERIHIAEHGRRTFLLQVMAALNEIVMHRSPHGLTLPR